ncbi:MAG: YihY/virulence factor BrkB family protein [Nitriliruptorales bacterium]|nr:YihY/virulence factor BrkB family protein [Nitriliruptorales bacterium]
MNPTIRRLVERSPAPLRAPIELVGRMAVDTFEDRVPGLSAEMAFYLVLSLPPLLITVFGAVAQLGTVFDVEFVQEARIQLDIVMRAFLTGDAAEDLNTVLDRVQSQSQTALLSFGFVVTVISASRALRVTTIAITIAYDLEATRPGWKQAVYGVLLTIAGIVIGIVLLPMLVAGPELGKLIARPLGLVDLFGQIWEIAYWPLAAITMTLLLSVLYHVAAPWWTPWKRDLPGAILAMTIGLLGSSLLRFYATRTIGGSESIFGPLAAPLVVLLWLYVMSFAVLLGAELNAEIEKMWPTKHPDQPEAREERRVAEAERERVS